MIDKLDILLREYAEVRRLLIEKSTALTVEQMAHGAPLTDAQRQVVLHDSAPIKPDPRMWTAEEFAEKQADYLARGHHRMSPLGNYVYTGPRSTDPQDLPLPSMSKEEIRAHPDYGILQRMVDAGL